MKESTKEQTNHKEKGKYRVSNWSEYNQSLVNRGSINLWIEEAAFDQSQIQENRKKNGRPYSYSNALILCALAIREAFKLPLRATEGFIKSLQQIGNYQGEVPTYSTLSRRQKKLEIKLPIKPSQTPRDIVIDSTGLKVYGEGEWKVRQHGSHHRRVWRKLHIALDTQTQEIIMAELTAHTVGDSEVLPGLIEESQKLGEISSVSADGAYDTKECHQAIYKAGAKAKIPPREGAKPWEKLESGEEHPRNQIIQRCQKVGKKQWKQESGYHIRSLVETAMYRLKQIFSGNLKNRAFETQQTEAYVRIYVLNKMTRLGMPKSYRIN